MKFCNNCGNQIDDNLSFCTYCGEPLESKPKRNISKKPIIIGAIILILAVCAFLIKDNVIYSYYVMKGDKENVPSQSVEYYGKALDKKYDKNIVLKIATKLKDDDNFEDSLNNLHYVLSPEDLNKIYTDIYVNKAKKNYDNNNFETCWKFLKKAETYGYNIEKFEYYPDLEKMSEEQQLTDNNNSNNSNTNQSNDDNNAYYSNDNDYIIADSDTRRLTKDELLHYSSTELAYIKNEIYARHGYVFDKAKYSNYFSSKNWYYPDPSFHGDDDELNSIEVDNVRLIKSLQ